MRIPITFVGSDGTGEEQAFPPNSQERYVRLKADFDNFRKRSQEEGRKLSQLGREAVLQDLIPLVESLERAIDASVKTGGQEGIREGIELVRQGLLSVLEKHGFQRIPTVGEPFDPRIHEAVAVLPSREVLANTVIEEVRPGFMREGKPLRPASVVVAC
jgi:molecular chaperone GrpE